MHVRDSSAPKMEAETRAPPAADTPARSEAPAAPALRRTAWAGYAACVWALLFAAISFYWAAGGTAGSDPIGPAITSMRHDPALPPEPHG